MEFFDPFAPAPLPGRRAEPGTREATRSADATSAERPPVAEPSAEPARRPVRAEALPARRWASPAPTGAFPAAGTAVRAHRPGASDDSSEPGGGGGESDPAASVGGAVESADRVDAFDPFGLEQTEAPARVEAAAPGARSEPAPEAPSPGPEAQGRSEPPAIRTHDQAVAYLREVARPALHQALSLVAQHGHEVDLADRLAHAESPALVVRFQPSVGPFRPCEASGSSRFELRLGVEAASDRGEDDSPDAEGFQVVAGHTPVALGARFVVLGRVGARALTAEWVTERFVGFVQHSLDHV